ncbi:MAG: primosomal protein N' [bacterium]|nr:primosomal protein N' [bacterium]
MKYAKIALSTPINKLFTYQVPDDFQEKIAVGQRVLVPFGKKKLTGYVIELAGETDVPKLKEIEKIIDEQPVIIPSILKLSKWMSEYYLCPLGEVLASAYPSALKKPKRKQNSLPKKSDKQGGFVLTEEQSNALDSIKKDIDAEKAGIFLLFGVTGSGKTEVYVRAVQHVLEKNKQAVILVPEIGITPQIVERFKSRFNNEVAVLHSRLKPNERYLEFERILKGEVNIVIGVRSAVFAPLKNLGLIIVDEEHDSSYKQTETPKYNARDVAIMRAKLENAVCLLGSATPSLESYHKAQKGDYKILSLTERIEKRALPKVEIIDLREEFVKKGRPEIFSDVLKEAIATRLEKKEQVILFINRRGFSNFVLCRECGEVLTCRNCDVSLTFYKNKNVGKCHYCGDQKKIPELCPKCGGGSLQNFGFGTEQVETELKNYFPDAKIKRMDLESTRGRESFEDIYKAFLNQEIDILVGTQMVTKGFDFENVTLVGVISADTNLNLPDFRASERTFQLLTQVAGRAGRGEIPGEVIIQTYLPEHYAIQASREHDYKNFYAEELSFREGLNYPPFSFLTNIFIKGPNEERVKEASQKLVLSLCREKKDAKARLVILGPAEASISKIKRQYRWQIILKTNVRSFARKALVSAIERTELPKGVTIHFDIDPQGIM